MRDIQVTLFREAYKGLVEQIVTVLHRFSMRYFKTAISNLIYKNKEYLEMHFRKSSILRNYQKIFP